MKDVTELLGELADGNPGAAQELFPLVYEQLRALAGAFFRDERPDHTLQPTALVHEAYVRLVGPTDDRLRTRVHFQALAGRVMRNLLVDHARRSGSIKRGGDRTRIVLADEVAATHDNAVDFEELDAALRELTALNERTGRVVELRFFASLSIDETAEVMEISVSSVEREWRFARAWLMDRLGGGDERRRGANA